MNKVEFIMRLYNGRWVRYPAASPDHDEIDYSDADMMMDPERKEQN